MNLVKFQDIKPAYRNQLCFYTNNKNLKKNQNYSIYKASKTLKYLGINLMKEVNDIYNVNYRTLMKENLKDTNMERSWTRRINSGNMSITPKMIYGFNANSYENSNGILHRNRKKKQF